MKEPEIMCNNSISISIVVVHWRKNDSFILRRGANELINYWNFPNSNEEALMCSLYYFKLIVLLIGLAKTKISDSRRFGKITFVWVREGNERKRERECMCKAFTRCTDWLVCGRAHGSTACPLSGKIYTNYRLMGYFEIIFVKL